LNDEKIVASTIRSEEELIKIYKDAYTKLLETMQYNNLRNIDNRHVKALLADVSGILKSLSSDTQDWIDDQVPKIYDVGVQIAHTRLIEVGNHS
jgi:thioester reductase-like protein